MWVSTAVRSASSSSPATCARSVSLTRSHASRFIDVLRVRDGPLTPEVPWRSRRRYAGGAAGARLRPGRSARRGRRPRMSRERRIHARTKTRLAARLARGDVTVAGVVENVGQGGAFFQTDDLEAPLPDGAEIVVTFAARRAGSPVELRLRGTVLRGERYFDGQ
ncbi:MAG: hypothetical protein DA328_08510, partial [Nitrososphaeraceae archaeon]|nr:hypothetical protein [Nitrososphaeraceae archaeon]